MSAENKAYIISFSGLHKDRPEIHNNGPYVTALASSTQTCLRLTVYLVPLVIEIYANSVALSVGNLNEKN